jgi:hypothetical protein
MVPDVRRQMTTDLYERDVHAWARDQALALRRLAERRPELDAEIDLANLVTEIEDMGKSLGRELVSRLVILLTHLAKWRWQPAERSRSWPATIANQRGEIAELLDENPSLRPSLGKALAKAWGRARRQAHHETGIAIAVFPDTCPFGLDDALAEGWLPGEVGE